MINIHHFTNHRPTTSIFWIKIFPPSLCKSTPPAITVRRITIAISNISLNIRELIYRYFLSFSTASEELQSEYLILKTTYRLRGIDTIGYLDRESTHKK